MRGRLGYEYVYDTLERVGNGVRERERNDVMMLLLRLRLLLHVYYNNDAMPAGDAQLVCKICMMFHGHGCGMGRDCVSLFVRQGLHTGQ